MPDLLGEGIRLLFIGVNPGLWTAAAQSHFARPGNRFYPALHAAGITAYRIDASGGMSGRDRDYLVGRGIGITNLVNRATVRADELSRQELRRSVEPLRAKIERYRPTVGAVLGITSYRIAFDQRRAVMGRQDQQLAGAELWALPNPSGINAHENVRSLARWYRMAAEGAGLSLKSESAD